MLQMLILILEYLFLTVCLVSAFTTDVCFLPHLIEFEFQAHLMTLLPAGADLC